MTNLFHSEKDTFFHNIQSFVSSADYEVLIIAPYIKTEVINSLIRSSKAKISIITTWNLQDLQKGVSDLNLFEYCKKNDNLYLYLNPRVHLKAFIKDYTSCIYGSANISEKGLALSQNYNYELNGKVETLNAASIFYFKKILHESILVDEEIVQQYRQALDKMPPIPNIPEPDLYLIPKKSEFLISALPMSSDINELYEIYSHQYQAISKEALDCAIHDIVLYNLPDNLSYEQFHVFLKSKFFSSHFIQKLLEFITYEGRYFGEVKTWIQENCEDVPVPSRRDLTGNIQVLYRWIVELSDGEYSVDKPHHSERLHKVRKK